MGEGREEIIMREGEGKGGDGESKGRRGIEILTCRTFQVIYSFNVYTTNTVHILSSKNLALQHSN